MFDSLQSQVIRSRRAGVLPFGTTAPVVRLVYMLLLILFLLLMFSVLLLLLLLLLMLLVLLLLVLMRTTGTGLMMILSRLHGRER